MSPTRWLAIIALVSAGGCRLFTAPQPSLRAVVRVDPSRVALGQPTVVTMTVFNTSGDTVQADNPRNYNCGGFFTVADAAGHAVPRLPIWCDAILYGSVALAPGDSLVLHDSWTPETLDAKGDTVSLPVGTYWITSQAVADDRSTVQNSRVAVTVTE